MTRKTQKKLRKLLTLVCCAVMLVCVSVGATIAYLTSQDSVTNTFTVGNVQIKLNETDTDDDDNEDDNETYGTGENAYVRDKANAYHLQPGQTHTKDPMVTVLANSEDCYVRALVTIKYAEAADKVVSTNWIDLNTTDWDWNTPATTKENGMITRVYEVRYKQFVEASDTDTELEKLFTKIEIPATINNADLAKLNGFEINIVAHAIQANGFVDANGDPSVDAAWAAFESAQN